MYHKNSKNWLTRRTNLFYNGIFMYNKEKHYIYRSSITVHGQRIYARDYGLKAFRIPII